MVNSKQPPRRYDGWRLSLTAANAALQQCSQGTLRDVLVKRFLLAAQGAKEGAKGCTQGLSAQRTTCCGNQRSSVQQTQPENAIAFFDGSASPQAAHLLRRKKTAELLACRMY